VACAFRAPYTCIYLLTYSAVFAVSDLKFFMFVCSDIDSGGVSACVRWTDEKKLGSGAYGKVFLGCDMDTGKHLAVKELLIHYSHGEASKVQRSMFRISFICTTRLCMIQYDMEMFNNIMIEN